MDCGSLFAPISFENCQLFGLDKKIKAATRTSHSYNNSGFKLVGIIIAKINFQGRSYEKQIRVVQDNYDSIMGRDWILPLNIDIPKFSLSIVGNVVHQTSVLSSLSTEVEKLVDKFAEIFSV